MDDELAFLIVRFGISSTIHVPIMMAGSPFAVIVFAAAGTRATTSMTWSLRKSWHGAHPRRCTTRSSSIPSRRRGSAPKRRLSCGNGSSPSWGTTWVNRWLSIDIRLEVLRRRSKDPEFLEDVDGLRASSRRMSRMIEQILDFTRSRLGGGLELVFAPMDLREALAPIVDELRAAHPSATIQLQCPELRGAWDRDRLEQVFSNLIGNALAHGDPDKPVTVTAGAEALRVWVQVHNEGPPIPQELQSMLFNPFRVGERASRSPAGLGLGLYISNEVIRRHGGQIEIRSTAVEGTTFRVVLPREAVGTPASERRSHTSGDARPTCDACCCYGSTRTQPNMLSAKCTETVQMTRYVPRLPK